MNLPIEDWKVMSPLDILQDEMLFFLFDVLYKCNYFMYFMEGHMVE